MKYLLVIVLFMIGIAAWGQEDEKPDTLDLEPVDTSYSHPIGFCTGGGIMQSLIRPSDNPSGDISKLKGALTNFFAVGILFHKEIKKPFALESGIRFNISRISVSYEQNNTAFVDLVNYSTMSVPFDFIYKPGKRPSGMFLAAGLSLDIDISKKSDKNNRLFPLKPLTFSLGAALGYRLKTYASIPEFRLFVNYLPLNILNDNNTVYTEALQSIKHWRLGILLSIR